MFDLIGDDGVCRPFTGDIRDLRFGVIKDRLRIDQADRTEIDADRWDYGLERSDQDVWIVGLFRPTTPEDRTTLALQYREHAWAASRTDAEPWPSDLDTLEIRPLVL